MKKTVVMLAGVAAVCALSGTSLAADPVATCRATKFKAAAVQAKSKLKCHGSALKKGQPVDPTCLARAEAVFQKAMLKAERSTPCIGGTASLQQKVDAFVIAVITDGEPKRVFVSSSTHVGGQLGGVAGGDAICAGLAANAGLTGTYKAWLSTASAHARDRLTHSSAPYVLVDGTQVDDDWTDLVGGFLDHAIDLDEQGNPRPNEKVWTGSWDDGTWSGDDCGGWTSTGAQSRDGNSSNVFAGWTAANAFSGCSGTGRLYCFEQ